ncbi:MAG: hypothetical protein JWR53_1506 [Glaciihabitans sp.]|nr:hypothetical protein [Glaciihabitans sp.]
MSTRPTNRPRRTLPVRQRALPLVGIASAVLGAIAMGWGFFSAILTALDGQRGTGFLVVFFVGVALLVAAIAIAIAEIVRPGPNALAILTLGVAALPLLGLIVVIAVARGAS